MAQLLAPSILFLPFLSSPVQVGDSPQVTLEPRTLGDYAAEVGKLSVPLVRDQPDTPNIELAFVRLQSPIENPGPPLFFLPGGPGNGATDFARSGVWAEFLEVGDVILMDPRGVGRSQPELSGESEFIQPELFFGDRETAVTHMVEVCEVVAAELSEKGIDLAGLTPLEMTDDLEDLRRALGYGPVNLMGHSFGTHLGLSFLRRYPESVARFVSVGTTGAGDMMKLPSDSDRSLSELSRLVAADPLIGQAAPDLAELFARVVARLEEQPLEVAIGDRLVELGPFGLQLLVVADLGDTNDLPVLPRLLSELDRGETSTLRWFLEKRLDQFSAIPIVMLAVRGSSGATGERWKRILDEAGSSPFANARSLFSPESDRALGVRDAGDPFREPVKSDVPTLMISGTLDAHTPPFQAERVRAGLTTSAHVVVQYGGHEDLLPDPEVRAYILDFLSSGRLTDAVVEREPLRFAPLTGPDRISEHPATY